MGGIALSYPPLEGEGRSREARAGWGGVTVFPHSTVPEWTDHPTPLRISLRWMRSDSPSRGGQAIAHSRAGRHLVQKAGDALDAAVLQHREVGALDRAIHAVGAK